MKKSFLILFVIFILPTNTAWSEYNDINQPYFYPKVVENPQAIESIASNALVKMIRNSGKLGLKKDQGDKIGLIDEGLIKRTVDLGMFSALVDWCGSDSKLMIFNPYMLSLEAEYPNTEIQRKYIEYIYTEAYSGFKKAKLEKKPCSEDQKKFVQDNSSLVAMEYLQRQ